MSLLVETIKLQNGLFYNLGYHQQRMTRSLQSLFGMDDEVSLISLLNAHSFPKEGLYKCRVLYDQSGMDVEFLPYQVRRVTSLKLMESDIDYSYKYADRTQLDKLFDQREDCDDILVVKKGQVTDTSYANIALMKDGIWYTPYSTLLEGTMRQSLIDHKMLRLMDIKVEDIKSFQYFKLINAMIGFESQPVDVMKIKT